MATVGATMQHAQSAVTSAVNISPMLTVSVIAVLVVLVLILLYYVYKYKKASDPTKSSFLGENSATGNNNPLWYMGSMDAGNGGSLARSPHWQHVSVYHDPYHQQGMREHLTTTPSDPSCAQWSPNAVVEAEALRSVGAFEGRTYGERSLERAAAGAGLTDEQLTGVMHQGGAP